MTVAGRVSGIADIEFCHGELVLPGKQLIAALGDRVETVSEDHGRFYLPALKAARPEDAKLIERLMQEGEPLEAWLARFRQAAQGESGLAQILGLPTSGGAVR